MAINTTDTYWSVNGVSLNTNAQNISTLAGRMSPPPTRGSNVVVPYSPGARYVPKVADSNTITLAMWVKGANPDGSAPTIGADAAFEDNWRALRRLLWTPGKQFSITKRFKVNGVLRSATALGEFAGGMEPTMMGRNGAKFTVDILLADPYFYDDVAVTKSLVTGANTLDLLGDADTANIIATISGSRGFPRIAVTSPLPHLVEYLGAITVGQTVQIRSREYSAITTPSGSPAYDSSGLISHSGHPQWLVLSPGTNNITLSGTGLGTVILEVRAAWI